MMKRLLLITTIALCALFAANAARGQDRTGYINLNELVRALPDYKSTQTALQAYQQAFVDEYNLMVRRYEKEQKKTDDNKTLTDAQRTAEEAKLRDMQRRMQNFQTLGQQKIDAKGNELLEPLVNKVKEAVADAAKELGYTNVLDNSQGAQQTAMPVSTDLMVAAKAKLGIK